MGDEVKSWTFEELQQEADATLDLMLKATGAAEQRQHAIVLESLKHMAELKSTISWQAERKESHELNKQQTEAMTSVAAKVPAPAPLRQSIRCSIPVKYSDAGKSLTLYCGLDFNHPGHHTAPTGEQWSWETQQIDGAADPANISGLCFAISPLAIGKPPYPCCELMRGHDGAHSDGTTNWTNAAEAPEPTKPAADQLHELLSYLIQQSQLSLEKSEHVMVETPVWRKHLAASKAYDDAAGKLQDILNEGGI